MYLVLTKSFGGIIKRALLKWKGYSDDFSSGIPMMNENDGELNTEITLYIDKKKNMWFRGRYSAKIF